MNLTVNILAETLAARLSGAGARLQSAMVRVINRLSIEVQRSVKDDKLTGQVLHVRTGTLRRSINRVVREESGGVIASVGTNVRYAAAHEYGFSGVENVKAFARTSKTTGKTSSVRAHTRQANVPERSFLRSTLREQSDNIRSQIRTAALEALK